MSEQAQDLILLNGYHLECVEGTQGGMLRPCEECGRMLGRFGDHFCGVCARALRLCRRCGEKVDLP